jgi:hypothetical protein
MIMTHGQLIGRLKRPRLPRPRGDVIKSCSHRVAVFHVVENAVTSARSK